MEEPTNPGHPSIISFLNFPLQFINYQKLLNNKSFGIYQSNIVFSSTDRFLKVLHSDRLNNGILASLDVESLFTM